MILVDASVIAKWYIPEEDSPAAIRLLQRDMKLVAPDLIEVEVSAAITKAVRLGRLEVDVAQESLDDWLEALQKSTIGTIPAIIDLPEAHRLSLEVRHPLQDCLYLAAAQRLKIPLATTDKRLVEQATKSGVEVYSLE